MMGKRSKMKKVIYLMFLVLCCCAKFGIAQDNKAIDSEKLAPPAEESFQAATGIATSRSQASCYSWEKHLIAVKPGCETLYFGKNEKYGSNPTYYIYNEDGTIWFDLPWGRPNDVEFRLSKEIGFEPFRYGPSDATAMRITGESENWYRVEVNEKTREIKYIPKATILGKKSVGNFLFFKLASMGLQSG